MKQLLVSIVMMVFLTTISVFSQTLLLQENFNYSAGQLTSAAAGANVSGGNWVNFGGTGFYIQVNSADLSYSGYSVSGTNDGKIDLLVNTTSAEDISRSFAAQSSGTVYASMLINVADTNKMALNSTSNGDYFTAFLPTANNTDFIARMGTKKASGTGNYLLGIRATTNETATWATAECVPGTTYLVVISYQFVGGTPNDVASLWINPDLSGPIPAPNAVSTAATAEPAVDISKLAFRQAFTNPSSTPNVGIDKIRVSDGWSLAPLPVELTSFTASMIGTNFATLKWSTATEINNNGFEIERRAEESATWVRVGFVPGAGTSNAVKNYSYNDNNVTAGRYAYRLQQVDNNGNFKYYQTLEVEIGAMPRTLSLFEGYPNPFNPSTKIDFTVATDTYARLSVFNSIGQEVASLFSGNAKAGYVNSIVFDAKGLPSGVYYSVLNANGQRLVKRLMLLK